MDKEHKLAEIPPLPFGRISRILFGVASFIVLGIIGIDALGIVGTVLLAGLGASFIIGGLFAIPGCEITAIPNLLLPKSMRFHFP
jgi:hypothetical protein